MPERRHHPQGEHERGLPHRLAPVEAALLRRALERAQVYAGGGLVVSYLLRDDFAHVGAAEPYSEGIIDYLRAVEGADMAALIREPPRGGTPARRVSLRASHDERVRRMPIVVLSHSEVLEDVARSYNLGANSHIAKPHSLDALFDVVETLGRYWLKIVSLPN